jgi:hypothetical protein
MFNVMAERKKPKQYFKFRFMSNDVPKGGVKQFFSEPRFLLGQ